MSDIVDRLNRADNLTIPGGPSSIFYDAAREIERLRLTDAEREAVERAADLIDAKTCGDSATLRGLLERTQPDARLAALERLSALDQSLEERP